MIQKYQLWLASLSVECSEAGYYSLIELQKDDSLLLDWVSERKLMGDSLCSAELSRAKRQCLETFYLSLREEVRRKGHVTSTVFSCSVPPDFLSFCLGEVQKGNNRTLAPSNSARVLPLAALEKDLISNVLNIGNRFCSH